MKLLSLIKPGTLFVENNLNNHAPQVFFFLFLDKSRIFYRGNVYHLRLTTRSLLHFHSDMGNTQGIQIPAYYNDVDADISYKLLKTSSPKVVFAELKMNKKDRNV